MGAIVGGGIATLLSLMVLSRAIVDNPCYRFAQYLLVGVALGYSAAVLVNQTLMPPVNQVIVGQASLGTIVVLSSSAVLLALFATRFGRQRASYLANIPLAVLFGISAAIALVGAGRGTLVPQLLDTIAARRFQGADAAAVAGTTVLILAVVVTLLSFTYAQRGETPSRPGNLLRMIGRGLILVAFGVFLSSAVTTYIAALVTQLQAIADWFTQLAGLF
jgi:hypothetical protein